ncbi:MAG: RluA family pseudouridine synthase [Candidatus Neomarinimicrobiota bacterium]
MKNQSNQPIKILYEDNHLLVVDKPAGTLMQGDETGDVTLLDIARGYIKEKYQKPGDVFLGLVHRIDRPASGVVVFARTSKAAARLTEQFQTKQVSKIYRVLVEGKIPDSGTWMDDILRDGVTSRIVKSGKGKPAELRFRRLNYQNGYSLAEVEIVTGRHHQIRVQFAHRGFPVFGDLRYGSTNKFEDGKAIALHSYSLSFNHPTKNERMTFTSEPDASWGLFVDLK